MYRFTYHVKFVAGLLKDLTHTNTLDWPDGSAQREKKRVEAQIESRDVIHGLGSSKYIITSYSMEQLK